MITVVQIALKQHMQEATHYKENRIVSPPPDQSQHGPDYRTILKVILPDSAVVLGVLKATQPVCVWCALLVNSLHTTRYKNKTVKCVAICHPVCMFRHQPRLIVISIFNKI